MKHLFVRLGCLALVLLIIAACDTVDVGETAAVDEPVYADALGKAERVAICHSDKDLGVCFSITVSEFSEAAHRAHGDGQIGDPVPDQPGYVFGDDCTPKTIEDPCKPGLFRVAGSCSTFEG